MPDIAERFLRTRAARSVEALRRSFSDNLFYLTGRSFAKATPADLQTALAYHRARPLHPHRRELQAQQCLPG